MLLGSSSTQKAVHPNKTWKLQHRMSSQLTFWPTSQVLISKPVTSCSTAILSIWPFLYRDPGTGSFGCHRINLYHITFLSEAPGARLGQRPRANSDTETFNISFSIRSPLGFPSLQHHAHCLPTDGTRFFKRKKKKGTKKK